MAIQLSDFDGLLEQYHKYDGYAMSCCVWHDDSSPSMLIFSNGYVCKSCGASGGIEKLYNYVSGRPIKIQKTVYNPSALIWDNWIRQFGSVASACTVAHNQLMDRPELGEYLYQRKLTPYQIKSGYLGYLGGYYIFPIRGWNSIIQMSGEIVGAIARASPSIQSKINRYSTSKNSPIKLYVPDWEAVNKSEDVYVPFGTLDAWTCLMAGYPSLTGLSGQSIKPEYFDSVRKRIWIIYDKGEEKKAVELQRGLGWRGRRLDIEWMDGTKDLNDIHKKYGIEEVKNKIEQAKEKYD